MKLIQIGPSLWMAVDQICTMQATNHELRIMDKLGEWHLVFVDSLEEAQKIARMVAAILS